MNALVTIGVVSLVAGALALVLVLVSAGLASRRREQLIGSEDPVIPVNLASVNDAVLVANVGGRVTFANEIANQWFTLEGVDPDLWLLAQKVEPADAFLELFATEGQASFTIHDRRVEAASHRVAVGELSQFIVVMREEAPLPVLDKEERGSSRALQVLSEVTRQINASLEQNEVLEATLDGIGRLVPYDAAQITLVDGKKDFLHPVARRGSEAYADSARRQSDAYRLDEGYTGWIARKRQPLIIDDVSTFTEMERTLRNNDPGFTSFMGVPLSVRNRFIGTLELMGALPDHFDKEDLAVLNLLAEQAAIAIENARQYRTQSERVIELSGLQKIAAAISDLRDQHQLYAQLGQRVAELMNTEMAGVLLFDQDGDQLVAQRPLYGVMDVFASRYEITLERGTPARSLWEDVEFWFSNDVQNDRIVQETELRELSELTGVRTTAMAAMMVGEERIGVLQVSNKQDGTPFTMEDIRLLQIYADQASIIVESARLYSEEQSRVAELQGLQQIAQAMSSFTNPEQLYGQLTQRIAELMDVEICGVLMFDEDEEVLFARKPFFGVSEQLTDEYRLSVAQRGLAREVWREYELFESNRVFTDEQIDQLGLRDIARAGGLQTLLLAPLSAGGRRFGMLQVSNKVDGSDFDDDDQRLITIFAGQAAALIDNARLYQDTDETLRKRAAELRSVSRISRELNATIELEPILEVIAVEAQRAEGADFGTLAMFLWNDAETETIPTMRFGAQVGKEAVILETAAARSGETLIIEDFERVPHYPSPIAGARSALVTPIVFENNTVGAISLYSNRPGGLSASAAEYIQALSSQATIAVTNATRHSEQLERSDLLSRRAEQLAQIFELGRMFRSDQSLENNLTSVAQAVRESAGFDCIVISALDSKRNELQPLAQVGLAELTFAQMVDAKADWKVVSKYLDDQYRLSFSYYVMHQDSQELLAELGLPAYTVTSQSAGVWQSGDVLLVPLRSSSDMLLGVLIVDRPRDYMIPTREVVELLEIFGNQAAMVIENSRLYSSADERAQELDESLSDLKQSYAELDKLSQEMIRKDVELSQANKLLNTRAQRLLALHRIMESVDTTQDPVDVLRDIATSVTREMDDIDQCVVTLAKPDADVEDASSGLEAVATAGVPRGADFTALINGRDPISNAHRSKEPVLFTIGKKRTGEAVALARAIRAETMSVIPMELDPEHNGVLLVGSSTPGVSFSEDDRDLFNLLASQIGVEYENARLYQAVQNEAATAAGERDRLQQLHLITTALQQTQQPHDRLTVIARGIRQVGWKRVAVTLHDEDMNVVDLVTVGYTHEQEQELGDVLLAGDVWKRRFEDPEFNTMRLGSSYFLPHDHTWGLDNVEGAEKTRLSKNGDQDLQPDKWHPNDQLYLPMYSGTSIIGMINLRDPRDGKRPSEATLRPLELFVQQSSSALENARLYQETLELQSFNEAVVQSIQQGIIVTDPHGRVESINSFMRDIYGWDDTVVGKNLFRARAELKELKLEDDVAAVARGGEPVEKRNIEYQVAEELRTLNLFIYPRLDEAKAVTGVVLLLEDNTQRFRLEADVAMRAQQLEALSGASRKITAALSTTSVLGSALEQAAEVMHYDGIMLWMHDRAEKSLKLTRILGKQQGDLKVGDTLHVNENPLFRKIIKDKDPLLVSDTRTEKYVPAGESESALTWLATPMLSGGNVIGILVFKRAEAHAYSPADTQVAAAYANQVAVALENARLFEEAEERTSELASQTHRLAMLNKVSATLGQSLDQASILQTVVNELVEALDVSQGSVYLFDQEADSGTLVAISPSNPDGSVPDYRIPLSDDLLVSELRESRKPLPIADVNKDELTEDIRHVFTEQKIKSTLAVPLFVGNIITGLITLDSVDKKHQFNEEQVELAQTITNQAAVSVQNARLFQETVARQRDLSILSEAGQMASASLDLDTVVCNAARYLMGALEVAGCTISLWDRDNDNLLPLIDTSQTNGDCERLVDAQPITLKEYPVIGSVVQDRGVIVLDIANPQLKETERNWLSERDITLNLLIPLVARGETIGLIELWESAEDRRFTQRQMRLSTSLTATIATAMENARLHDETQHRLSELARINQISRALTQTITAEDLYQILQQQVQEVFDVRSMTIVRHDERTNQLFFPLAVRKDKRLHIKPEPDNGNLYSHVIDTKEALLLNNNLSKEMKRLKVKHIEPGLKSFLAVPLFSGENAIGVLAIEDYQRANAFHENVLRVLEPIAAQVAVSIENTRLYNELEQRLSETTTLQEVSRVVNSALDLQDIFDRVVSELANAFKYPLIGLFSVEGNELVLQAEHGYGEEGRKRFARMSMEAGIAGRAAMNGKPQFIENVKADPDYLALEDWVRSDISVPIVADDKVLGVVSVEAGEEHPLQTNDLQLLITFADQVATAMSNARLFSEMVDLSAELEQRVEERTRQLKEERDRIDTLYRIAVELTASLDLDRVLNRALELVGDAVGAEHGSLYLVDPQSDKLIHRAVMSDSEILPPGGRQIPLSRHEGMAGWVMDHRESLVVDNVQEDARWSNVPGTEHNRSLLGAPLVANHEVLGCIFFTSDVMAAFGAEHVRLVEAAAQQVANSINNAELYRMIRDQAERLGIMLRSQQTEAAKSQAILESVADGVMVSDQANEVVLFNAAAERILDLRRDEVLGLPSTQMAGLYGAGAERWTNTLREWGANPSEYIGEFLSERLEIGDKVVSVHVSPVMNGSEYLGLVSVFRDITREVLSDRIKTQFVANVSHELRTPLTVIKGYADLLLLGRAGDINPEQRDYLDRIKRHADRLTMLVNDLLEISRIEQGSLDLTFRDVDLAQIVENMLGEIEVRMNNEEREVEFQVDLADDLPLIQADTDRIKQIVNALLSNAYQYTDDGGTVSVTADVIDGGIQLDVQDTGIGIPEEDQEHVFDRFFRGEHPLIMKAAGTGLGLAIVHHLIELQHGRVWFESTEGEGTIFSFWLPTKQPVEEQ